ncbi:hypothetical protein HDU87_001801 [Geranomyces variabilis]|uniref:Uncharacterized protein n=1 Tax=Geranomyces variabilis TaxID=109894 RepID=A0AAD5TMZ1_9FUNG|nr:hypothetical protein HDU87_001801 [Geranomyces variabilis]
MSRSYRRLSRLAHSHFALRRPPPAPRAAATAFVHVSAAHAKNSKTDGELQSDEAPADSVDLSTAAVPASNRLKSLAALFAGSQRPSDVPAPMPTSAEEHSASVPSPADAQSADPGNSSHKAVSLLQEHFDATDETDTAATSPPDESARTLLKILQPDDPGEEVSAATFADVQLKPTSTPEYRKNPEVMFPHLERLFARPASAASARFWTRAEWRSIMITLSLSSNRSIAKTRIITALQWKLQCGVSPTVGDVLMLASFTAEDRRTAEDAEMFVADIKAQFGLEPDAKIHVQLIHGLAQMTSGEEAGRFVQNILFQPDGKQRWTPEYFRTVHQGLIESYNYLYQRFKNPPNRLALARLERAESNAEKMLRIFMILFKDIHGDLADTDIYNGTARIVRHTVKTLDDAQLFLGRMRAEGFDPNTETYSLLADHLIDNGAHSDATELLKSVHTEGLVPDKRTASTAISALAAEGRTSEAWDMWCSLSETDKANLLGDQRFCDIFISTLMRRPKGRDRTLAFAQAMCAHGTVPRPSANRRIIYSNLWKEAAQLKIAVHYFNRVKAAIKLPRDQLAGMHEMDHPLGRHMHNQVISDCAKNGDINIALQVYFGMEELGLKPNAHTITPLIHHCARLKMHDTSRALIADVEKYKIKPDVVLYTTLVMILANSKQFRTGAKVLKRMEEAGVPPNEHTYNVFISGLVRAGNFTLAKKIRDGMQLPDNKRSKTIASNIILGGLIRSNHSKEVVLSTWKDMQDAQFVDRASLNVMIPFLFRQGDIDEAKRIADTITTTDDYTRILQTSNIFIQSYLKLGRVQEALDIFNTLERPDLYTFLPLVRHYATSKDLATAERLIHQYLVTVPRYEREARIAEPLLTEAGKLSSWEGVQTVERTLDALRKAGARPDAFAYAAALGAYHQMKAVSQASDLLKDIIRQPHAVNGHSAIMNAVIDGYAKSGDIAGMERAAAGFAQGIWPDPESKAANGPRDDVLTVWASQKPSERTSGPPRLEPNMATLNVLIGGYGYARRLNEVLRLYQYMCSHNMRVYSGLRRSPNEKAYDVEEYEENSRPVSWRITYSLLFDALGFARDRESLELYWREVREAALVPLDNNNWTSYLEAKMRCGCVAETLAILNSPPAEFVPDVKTLTNVLGLSKAAADEHIVRGPPAGEPPLPAKATLQSLTDLIVGRIWAVINAKYPEHVEVIKRGGTKDLLARLDAVEGRFSVAASKAAFTGWQPATPQGRLVFSRSTATGQQRGPIMKRNHAALTPGGRPKPDSKNPITKPVVVKGPMSALISHYERAANAEPVAQTAHDAERETRRKSQGS